MLKQCAGANPGPGRWRSGSLDSESTDPSGMGVMCCRNALGRGGIPPWQGCARALLLFRRRLFAHLGRPEQRKPPCRVPSEFTWSAQPPMPEGLAQMAHQVWPSGWPGVVAPCEIAPRRVASHFVWTSQPGLARIPISMVGPFSPTNHGLALATKTSSRQRLLEAKMLSGRESHI